MYDKYDFFLLYNFFFLSKNTRTPEWVLLSDNGGESITIKFNIAPST